MGILLHPYATIPRSDPFSAEFRFVGKNQFV